MVIEGIGPLLRIERERPGIVVRAGYSPRSKDVGTQNTEIDAAKQRRSGVVRDESKLVENVRILERGYTNCGMHSFDVPNKTVFRLPNWILCEDVDPLLHFRNLQIISCRSDAMRWKKRTTNGGNDMIHPDIRIGTFLFRIVMYGAQDILARDVDGGVEDSRPGRRLARVREHSVGGHCNQARGGHCWGLRKKLRRLGPLLYGESLCGFSFFGALTTPVIVETAAELFEQT
jgi:hypothetical protein